MVGLVACFCFFLLTLVRICFFIFCWSNLLMFFLCVFVCACVVVRSLVSPSCTESSYGLAQHNEHAFFRHAARAQPANARSTACRSRDRVNENSAHLSLPLTRPSLLRFVAQIHCSNSLLGFVVQICCTDWLHIGC